MFLAVALIVGLCALTGGGAAFAVPSPSGDTEALMAGESERAVSTSAAGKRAPRLQEVDGGLGYYGRFSDPLSTSASYFPIGVWGAYSMERSNIAKDKAVGLNTYVWFADPSARYVANARAAGMHLIVNRSEGGSHIGSETFGRLLGDELDMQEGPGRVRAKSTRSSRRYRTMAARGTRTTGRACSIWGATGFGGHNDRTSACFVNAQDITSTDLYWHTDPYETNHPQSGMSSAYGWSIRRMRKLDAMDGKRTPQWGFVEVTNAMNGPWGAPTPAEIRGAVWHTLIAGARGIIYFQHDFEGSVYDPPRAPRDGNRLLRGDHQHGHGRRPPDQAARRCPQLPVCDDRPWFT